MDIKKQRRRIRRASRKHLIRLVEQDGLRDETQEQFRDWPKATLETVKLAEFQDVMAGVWAPETEFEGLKALIAVGIVEESSSCIESMRERINEHLFVANADTVFETYKLLFGEDNVLAEDYKATQGED